MITSYKANNKKIYEAQFSTNSMLTHEIEKKSSKIKDKKNTSGVNSINLTNSGHDIKISIYK
jgi:hypothetical protein